MGTNKASPPAGNAPLFDNQYDNELVAILENNGRDPSGLTELLSHVNEIDAFIRHAENRIAEMKRQLDSIKELQNQPVKAALQNAIKRLEGIVAKIKARIETLKTDIAEGCKNAVGAFKDTGISALDNLATYFDVKGDLQAIRLGIDEAMKTDDRAIEKIVAFSKEYHSAGRALKNMARLAIGKKPLDPKTEAGKLARAVAAPYKTHKFIMLSMRNNVNKALTRLETLQAKAWAKKAVHSEQKKPETRKPSITERLQKNLNIVENAKREHRQRERVAAKGAEI